ncbi:MAG TPA: hypothetical protein VGI88_15865 [Verrucomicrobiae bacterium]|jgi:hypothetical protein
MSFRFSILGICRAGIAGLLCVASVALARGQGSQSQSIEIVPLSGATPDTNLDHLQPARTKNFENVGPRVPHSIQFEAPSTAVLPPPPRQNSTPTERDKELLDRRKNWVFMTTDDMMGQAETDLSGGDRIDDNRKSTTAMERYFQHLNDAGRPVATNQFSRVDSDPWMRATNSITTDDTRSGDGFFNTMDPGTFQPNRASGFSDIFSSSPSADTREPSPETVRLQQEQKEHIESFKQLWDIDQPPAPAPTASVPVPVPSSSGSVFGTPLGSSGQPSLNTFNTSLGGLSGQAPPPPTPTINSSRSIQPPHADFAPPQRPF